VIISVLGIVGIVFLKGTVMIQGNRLYNFKSLGSVPDQGSFFMEMLEWCV
jgi:hypothetical protein